MLELQLTPAISNVSLSRTKPISPRFPVQLGAQIRPVLEHRYLELFAISNKISFPWTKNPVISNINTEVSILYNDMPIKVFRLTDTRPPTSIINDSNGKTFLKT